MVGGLRKNFLMKKNGGVLHKAPVACIGKRTAITPNKKRILRTIIYNAGGLIMIIILDGAFT